MGKLDDVSYHTGAADFSQDAPEENGATHIGMFLTWAIKKGLFTGTAAPAEAVDAVRKGSLSGREFLFEYCNGKLLSEFFTPAGAAFAVQQYSAYIEDYERLLGKQPEYQYLVEDNQANYEIMAESLDRRWAAFQTTGKGR
jgi:hypothetical protein